MNRDDIIRMARDAGSIDSEDVIETMYRAFTAAEREACLKIAEAYQKRGGFIKNTADAIRARSEIG